MAKKLQDFVKNFFNPENKEEVEEISGDDEIEKEFQEMKRNFQRFIAPLPKIVKEIDRNVFYNVVNAQRTKERLVIMARETRPFLAKETWNLLDDYMDFLRNLPGIEGENYRAVYENLTKHDLVKRFLFKRPIVFCGRPDYYILRHDGKKFIEGDGGFYYVARCLNKPQNAEPYLKEYISYDENLMSSLIGMSTPTFYFSIGSGRFALNADQPHIDEGILCGLVGARHGKLHFMEHRFTYPRLKDLPPNNLLTIDTCHKSDKFWIEKVYSDAFPEKFVPTLEDIQAKPEIYDSIYVDGVNEVYLEKRLTLSILPFIQEAMTRGIEKDKGVFCSVPPIGGGCWAIGLKRETVHRLIVTGILKFLDSFDDMQKLKTLKALVLPELDIKFYSLYKTNGNITEIRTDNDEIILHFKEANHEIKVINKLRYVAELLPEEFKDCISIAGFAWDGNSYPGNEYWSGNFGSFDPKAVYCSLLGQFQNPEVNVKMADPERIRKTEVVTQEFEEMKARHEEFISHLSVFVRNIKKNVFYHVLDDQRTKEKMVNMALETRPFLAKEIWDLLDDFMDFMRNLPRIEGKNYTEVYKNFSKPDLVKRLLFKRPIIFCGRSDYFMLRYNGENLMEGEGCFNNVAGSLEKQDDSTPYLREYISYDENLLSSLIGMSTPTFYFSIGSDRYDIGDTKKPHIDEGILCGLVGARNEKPYFMEHRFVFPKVKDYDSSHKSDQFWIEKVYRNAFPEKKIPTVEDIRTKPEIYDSIYVEGVNEVYLEKRLMLSILPYIQEAMSRGVEKDRNIFCSVPPIGAGVWAVGVRTTAIRRLIVNGVLKFLDSYNDKHKLKHLKALALPEINISFYSEFKFDDNIKEIEINIDEVIITFKRPAEHKLKIINRPRYVAELLPVEFRDCISVAGYAWDGNSYPGNEYWNGGMGSFDPQAIYCSLLGQFQNPEVNVKMADPERIRVYSMPTEINYISYA
ncbi:uncharacterized protein [Chironomus tepperi]|uniref:uncharacterized protein n=1 Tax=Chironomus tepperi TaxID=113505 RepID=UPI00391F5617